MDPRTGQTLDGRYVVRQRIGKGGMGAVYEGEHLGLDRRVAIKFLAHHGLSATERERFRREARLASRVVHENVSQVYDIGAHEGDDFIVMEFVEGRDLGRVIKEEGPLEVARAIQIARDLLLGLHAVHAEGIVHRDVKPTNVMLTMRGGRECVKIVDFGIARAIDERTLTRSGYVVGTAEFMAPEQFRGGAVDHRADLYAVGISVFAMLTTELPFTGATAAVGAMQVFEKPPSLDAKRPGLPPMLVAAVERALAKAPSDRFADALQFAAALERSVSGEATPVPEVTRSTPTVSARPPRRARRRRPWLWLMLGATIVLAAAGGILATRRSEVSPTAPVVTTAVRPDAAVSSAPTPDAQINSVQDAAVAEVRDAAVVARPPAVPPPAKGSARDQVTVPRRCRCIPRDGRENVGLCPEQSVALCRCDLSRGQSLCSKPPIKCPQGLIDRPDHVFDRGGRSIRDICRFPHWQRCPDLNWDRYTTPGKHGAPCTGYNLTSAPDAAAETGALVCDSCPTVNTLAYRGVEGAPCSGFWWRTGEPLEGTLQQCED